MDSMGAIISEGDWSCLSGMYSTDQEADFMAQLLGNFPLADHDDIELDGTSNFASMFPSFYSTTTISMTTTTSASGEFSQGSSHSGGSTSANLFPCSSQDSFYQLSDHNSHPIFGANNSPMSMDFCMEDAANNTTSYLVEADDHCLNQEMGMINGNHVHVQVQHSAVKTHQEPAAAAAAAAASPIKNLEPKREPEQVMPKPERPIADNKTNMSSESCKKRSRSSGDHVQKPTRKNARSKKNQLQSSNTVSSTSIKVDEDGNGNGGLNGQSSASCSSEDDSQELHGGVSSSSASALNLNVKTRASRGAATDPQSLYARKRRERINERLRILQNLVPNGTKVDISTMLEEAVQYVKFLQLQIKLLSSDDLWMYAPIAYNGMDIGLDHLKVKVGAGAGAGATTKGSS